MEHGEVRSVVALKPGVGDHAPERFADHEPRQSTLDCGFGRSRSISLPPPRASSRNSASAVSSRSPQIVKVK